MGTRNGCRGLSAALGLASALAVAPLGAITLFDVGTGVSEAPVYEYYNATQDHYFVTAAPQEIALLDALSTAEWKRRGDAPAFTVFDGPVTALDVSPAKAAAQPVCRFFIPPASHFLSASIEECAKVAANYPEFVFETAAAFYAWLPDPATGACPRLNAKIGGFEYQPVYRLWNGRSDTNHRLTTSVSERAALIAAGWVAEGYGDDGVAMCVPHWDNPTAPQ